MLVTTLLASLLSAAWNVCDNGSRGGQGHNSAVRGLLKVQNSMQFSYISMDSAAVCVSPDRVVNAIRPARSVQRNKASAIAITTGVMP